MENQEQREITLFHHNAIDRADSLQDMRAKLENFTKATHKDPNVVKSNQYSGGAQYVPIEELEMLMDEIFLGHWKTRTIEAARVVGDSIAYDLEVDYLHPVSGVWLTRAGSGAVPIELEGDKKDRQGNILSKGALNRLDFEKINSKAIHKNAPAAKAMAFRNAVQSIARMFGRDLNRDKARHYEKKYSKRVSLKAQDHGPSN